MDGVEWEGRTRGRTGTRGGRRRKETTTTTAVAAGVQGGTRVEVVGPAQQRQTRVASCFTLAGSVLDNPQIEKVVGFKKKKIFQKAVLAIASLRGMRTHVYLRNALGSCLIQKLFGF